MLCGACFPAELLNNNFKKSEIKSFATFSLAASNTLAAHISQYVIEYSRLFNQQFLQWEMSLIKKNNTNQVTRFAKMKK